MTLFYFYTGDTVHDAAIEAVDLANLDVARSQAAQLLVELSRNTGARWADQQVIVADHRGLILFTMAIAETQAPAIAPAPSPPI